MATPLPPGATEPFDFARGFRFVFEDPDWVKKILIGGVVWLASALLIGAPLAGGYILRVIVRTARRQPRPLPDWDDIGGLFMDGLKVLALYVGHLLVIAIPIGALALMAIMVIGVSSTSSDGRGSDALAGLMGVGFFGMYALVMVFNLLLALYIPAAILRLAMGASLGSAFDPRENLALIRRNLGNYALALVLYVVASFISQFGAILCCIGVFPMAFWAACVLGWGMGEVARRDPVLSPEAALIPTA